MRVGGEGVVVAEDVLLDGLVHVSTDGKQMFRTIFVPHHFFNPRPVPQQPLLVPLVALKCFLVPVLLLRYFFIHHLYVLGKGSKYILGLGDLLDELLALNFGGDGDGGPVLGFAFGRGF